MNMQNNPRSSFPRSVQKGKLRIAICAVVLLMVLILILIVMLKPSGGNSESAKIVIRIDDVQDFAFREAQSFLLDESIKTGVPFSLAVIAGMFGEDEEIIQKVELAIMSGSEVTVHGWKHEDLTKFSFMEQRLLLSQSRSRIKETLDYDARVLVPPMFSFNQDTISATYEEGYHVISALVDFSKPGPISNVINIPATVELSDLSNGIWTMKNLDSVYAEISRSIQEYGFAVIVTHPQEFITDGTLNEVNTELYRILLKTLTEDYSFQTLEKLSEEFKVRP